MRDHIANANLLHMAACTISLATLGLGLLYWRANAFASCFLGRTFLHKTSEPSWHCSIKRAICQGHRVAGASATTVMTSKLINLLAHHRVADTEILLSCPPKTCRGHHQPIPVAWCRRNAGLYELKCAQSSQPGDSRLGLVTPLCCGGLGTKIIRPRADFHRSECA
jgi:hypothetical protein